MARGEPSWRVRAAVTKSLCAGGHSSCDRDAVAPIVIAMDVLAIILGVVTFAILLISIEGIDRV